MIPIDPVAAVKGAYDLTKRGLEIAEKLKDVELKEIILGLKEEVLIRKEEILSLKQRISEIEENSEMNSKLYFDKNNLLWLIDGDKKQGPYCSQCKDSDNKMIRLHAQLGSRGTSHICPTCKAHPDFHSLEPHRSMHSNRGGW